LRGTTRAEILRGFWDGRHRHRIIVTARAGAASRHRVIASSRHRVITMSSAPASRRQQAARRRSTRQRRVRHGYLEPAKDPTVNHGKETYYGQDFYIRMSSGRGFVMGLPYPFKDRGRQDFQTAKSDTAHYGGTIGRALRIVREFVSDLYGSSLVPITLAHQHASISLKPGGRVLDILSKQSLDRCF
jgi:hypothetical protein